jgi:hypothetical protein
VRQLLVSRERTVSKTQTKVGQERNYETERVPKRVHFDMQADPQVHDR